MQRKKRGKPGRKPVVRAECLARLKGGEAPTELLGEFKPGPVYDALREYLVYSAGEVEEIRKSKSKEQQELARIKDEVRALEEVVAARRADVETLTKNVRELNEDVKDRERRVSELRLEEDRLDSKLEEYTGKGITDKTFRRLDRISFGGQDELISRLDTTEKHLELVLETKKKGTELLTLTNKVNGLGLENEELAKEIVTLKNKRDEELSKNYVQSESIRILSTFYKDKYTSKDIEGIRIGLNILGISGNPRTSVKRLVDALRGELDISRLNTEIIAKSIELEKLVNVIEVAKGELNSHRDVALASIKEFEVDSKAYIEDVYTEAASKVKSMGDTTEKHIEEVSSNYISAIEKASRTGISTLINVHNQAKLEIDETVDTVRSEVQATIRQEFEPYREAFKLIPHMQPFASYGFLLMRVPSDRLVANKIPAIFVATMAASIDSWVREMLPEAETKPPKDIQIVAPMLFPELSCKLFAVSTWLRQELANKTRFK
jgi:hypothetical protein